MRKSTTPKPDLIGRTPGTRSPVFIRDGFGAQIGAILRAPAAGQRIALVSDSIVWRLHGSKVMRGLVASGWTVDFYKLTPGERIKSSRVISKLHDSWFARGYDRSTPIVALGGGTVGDGVGFAAATFQRGLPLWHVPTTLVGQVDSSIGGKVGINHDRGKNLIGCFYQPSGVIIDPEFLTTLPAREVRSGLAEVIKYGVISDPRLFRHCERSVASWIAGQQIDTATLKSCVNIKLKVVRADERDTGLRHILNFGHTLGHAFEAWGNFRTLKHGEAVTLGMVAASRIAIRRGIFAQGEFDRVLNVLRRIAPQPRIVRFEPSGVIPYLSVDKKRVSGRNAWVLPVAIGKVTIVRDVADNEVRDAVRFVRGWAAEKEQV